MRIDTDQLAAHLNRGLSPLYTLYGETLPPEASIDQLPGYAGSRPVRVGNAANMQVQLDVFGPVVQLIFDLVHKRVASGRANPLTDSDWNLVSEMVFAVESRWVEPDHGIWEMRGNPRHHVYSKVMCRAALDRAIAMADLLHVADRVDGWKRQREEIWNIIARARPGVRKRALSRNTSGPPPWMPPT